MTGEGDEAVVAREVMGLRKIVVLGPKDVDLLNAKDCPFRVGHACKIACLVEEPPPVSSSGRFMRDGKKAGYTMYCEAAPPECPLRFGDVVVRAKSGEISQPEGEDARISKAVEDGVIFGEEAKVACEASRRAMKKIREEEEGGGS